MQNREREKNKERKLRKKTTIGFALPCAGQAHFASVIRFARQTLVDKQRRRQVALGGIGEQNDNRFIFEIRPLGDFICGMKRCA